MTEDATEMDVGVEGSESKMGQKFQPGWQGEVYKLETGKSGRQAGFRQSMPPWSCLSDDMCLYKLLQMLFRGGRCK